MHKPFKHAFKWEFNLWICSTIKLQIESDEIPNIDIHLPILNEYFPSWLFSIWNHIQSIDLDRAFKTNSMHFARAQVTSIGLPFVSSELARHEGSYLLYRASLGSFVGSYCGPLGWFERESEIGTQVGGWLLVLWCRARMDVTRCAHLVVTWPLRGWWNLWKGMQECSPWLQGHGEVLSERRARESSVWAAANSVPSARAPLSKRWHVQASALHSSRRN